MLNLNDIPQLAVTEDEPYRILTNYAITAKKSLAIFGNRGLERDIFGNSVLLNNDVAKENRVSFTELHKLGDLRGGSVDYLPGVAYQSR